MNESPSTNGHSPQTGPSSPQEQSEQLPERQEDSPSFQPRTDAASSPLAPRLWSVKRIIQVVYTVLCGLIVGVGINGDAGVMVLLLLLAFGIGLYIIELFFIE
jgi:hypothetical protein